MESRGWGRRAPQSPSSSSFGAPQGNNEIYTYDVVFRIGEANTKPISPTQLPYRQEKSKNPEKTCKKRVDKRGRMWYTIGAARERHRKVCESREDEKT